MMSTYILRRLLSMIPVVLLVTLAVFSLLILLPGDPVVALMGEENLDPLSREKFRQELGLDKPIMIQYLNWLGRALQGDLGRSIRTQQPVLEAIFLRVPVTLQLGLTAWVLAILLAVPAGVISAVKQNSKWDILATIFAMGGVALPNFWFGILLILLLSVTLRWLPPSGYVSLFENPLLGVKFLIMPALTLATGMAAVIMRQVRSSLLEVMREDYITTARSKGLAERTVIAIHALKNAFLPVVTVMGLQIGRILGGTVIVEQIFALPGMGRLGVSAIFMRDFPVVQGVVLVMALAVLISNLITDLIYGYLDPRIRYT